MFCFFTLSSGEYDLKTSLCKAFGRLIGGRRKPTGSFSYLCCPQSLWLLGTCLGSDRAAHGFLTGLSSAVLWLKRSFLPFHLLGTGGQRQLKRWGKVLTVFLSPAEKVAMMLSLEHILGDRVAGFKAPLSNFQFPFCSLLSDILTVIWVAGLQNYFSIGISRGGK